LGRSSKAGFETWAFNSHEFRIERIAAATLGFSGGLLVILCCLYIVGKGYTSWRSGFGPDFKH